MSFADKLKDPKTLKKALQLAQSLKKLDKNRTAGGSSTNSYTLGSLQKDVAKLKRGARQKPGTLATRNATVAGSSVVGSPVAGSQVVNVAPKKKKKKRRPIDGIAQTGLTRGRVV